MAKTVLVLDKQVVARRMLRFAMELQGYRVVDADDIPGALGILSGGEVDLLIVGFNGSEDENIEMINHARRYTELTELPVLLVGDSRLKTQSEFRGLGSCAWLNKPFQMNDIHNLVESMLGNAPLPVQLQVAAVNGREHA